MLEPWDEVLALEKERQLCADDVEAIKSSCAKDHSKAHVTECPECWSRLVNRMRDRYLNSATKEWFSGRRMFLQELDTLFSQAHEGKTDIKAIEQRICEEKKEWFRDKVRNLGLQAAAKNPTEARDLQQKMNDRSIPADQLALQLREAFSDSVLNSEEALGNFLGRLKAAKTPQAKAEAYIDVFFQPEHDPSGAARSKEYIEMVRNGTPMTELINVMLRDRQSSLGSQDQKQNLQKKVEEFRRAKAAHELQKSKKAKQRQDKANAAAALTEPSHNFPPCLVCSKNIDTQDFSLCPICLVLGEKYHMNEEPNVVFCSTECWDKGYASHNEEAHACASGSGCITIQDEDVDMDDEGDAACLCRECVEELEMESVFCSPRCFDSNFQRHREDVHIPRREHAGELVDDEKDLEYSPEDKTRYRARKIEDHFMLLHDATADLAEKMEISVL
ncbi:hypothetical protein BX600DRAFT_512919 [Xylariales sp. PMI_506]|nr:hypothetical protein BX600DRAFT_512919 [Xylariales sp. PMI_506]